MVTSYGFLSNGKGGITLKKKELLMSPNVIIVLFCVILIGIFLGLFLGIDYMETEGGPPGTKREVVKDRLLAVSQSKTDPKIVWERLKKEHVKKNEGGGNEGSKGNAWLSWFCCTS